MRKVAFLLVAVSVLALSGCDLINFLFPKTAKVELVVKNLPAPDGSYGWSGDFRDDFWNNTTRRFSLVQGGGGFSDPNACVVTTATFVFTINAFGTWDRPWYPAMSGNEVDPASESPINFICTVPLDGQIHTITVDGMAPNLVSVD